MGVFAAGVVACTVCANPSPVSADGSAGDKIEMEASIDARVGGTAVGSGSDRIELVERRLEARFAIRPVDAVELAIGMPVLFRTLRSPDARWVAVEPGDLDLQVNATLYADPSPLRHSVFMTGVIKFPTAPVAEDPGGALLASNLQPGCSSVIPGLGGAYELGWDIWSFQFGAALLLPIVVREAPHRAASVRQTSTARVRPFRALSFVAGWTWLVEAVGQDQFDSGETDSGGVAGLTTLAIEAGGQGRVTASMGLDIPVVAALRGAQEPTPIGFVRIGVRWDAPR